MSWAGTIFCELLALEGLKGGNCEFGVVVTAREAMQEEAEAKGRFGSRSSLPHRGGRAVLSMECNGYFCVRGS